LHLAAIGDRALAPLLPAREKDEDGDQSQSHGGDDRRPTGESAAVGGPATTPEAGVEIGDAS
jgi:hypothetical protein